MNIWAQIDSGFGQWTIGVYKFVVHDLWFTDSNPGYKCVQCNWGYLFFSCPYYHAWSFVYSLFHHRCNWLRVFCTIFGATWQVQSSDVDSDDESFHTKTRHVLRRLQSGHYDRHFALGVYRCLFCKRKLRANDFNYLVNHAESIGRYGARVGMTVNVHAFMAQHKALGIHLRSLQASHRRYLEALNVPTALSVCDCSICRAA